MREDSSDPRVTVEITRSHAFGDVTIYWRLLTAYPVTSSGTTPRPRYDEEEELGTTVGTERIPPDIESSRLESHFRHASGAVTCTAGRFDCDVTIELIDDEVRR